MKRAAMISRKVVDPVNSVAWFGMDGLWLAELSWPAYAATALTLLTGGTLLATNRRFGRRLFDDLALNAWMWTNALWLMSDLGQRPVLRSAAMVVGCVGAILLFNAIRPSPGHDSPRRLTKLRLPDR